MAKIMLKLLVLVIVFAVSGCGGVRGKVTTGFSGHEVFEGKTSGSVTSGVLFAGKDNNVCGFWTTNENGGVWTASVSFVGKPGIDSSGVKVKNGKWLWQEASGVIHSGGIDGGKVKWPSSIDDDSFDCGKGVASVTLELNGEKEKGIFTGCLDDTHLNPQVQPFVFPPKIWGTLILK